jgi:hypothetical protein
MINKTVLSLTNENSKIFLNIVDNRIEMWLGSVTSSEIQSIYNFIISKKNLIKKSFTTIIDLTDFIAKDDSVHESMNIVQNLFTEMGWVIILNFLLKSINIIKLKNYL